MLNFRKDDTRRRRQRMKAIISGKNPTKNAPPPIWSMNFSIESFAELYSAHHISHCSLLYSIHTICFVQNFTFVSNLPHNNFSILCSVHFFCPRCSVAARRKEPEASFLDSRFSKYQPRQTDRIMPLSLILVLLHIPFIYKNLLLKLLLHSLARRHDYHRNDDDDG